MIELLAALSASAATGIRIAVPLLLIGIIQGDQLWSHVPIFSSFPPSLVVGVLVSWALAELMLSKARSGMRIVQLVQLALSPLCGAIAGITVADIADFNPQLLWLIGIISGLLALVLQVVQIGWFYRLRGLPLWAIFLQDFVCVTLLLMAFDAPRQGGLIALVLMWLALRSAVSWRQWNQAVPSKLHRLSPLDRPLQNSPRGYYLPRMSWLDRSQPDSRYHQSIRPSDVDPDSSEP